MRGTCIKGSFPWKIFNFFIWYKKGRAGRSPGSGDHISYHVDFLKIMKGETSPHFSSLCPGAAEDHTRAHESVNYNGLFFLLSGGCNLHLA